MNSLAPPVMFGERFFATRKRLTGVVSGVDALGRDCGAENFEITSTGQSFEALHEPFRIMVCGEVNAGKSTLINALFGQPLCEVGKLPTTKKLTWFRWGEDERTTDDDERTVIRWQPDAFLRDFEVVDTPGVDATLSQDLPAIELLLPEMDLLLFVFPVSNPWSAATWQLVARLPEEQLTNAAFVLQQADQKTGEDLEVILGHMRTLVEQKTGSEQTIYPVSAHLALEAKKSRDPSIHLLRKSGFLALQNFISGRINFNAERRGLLQDLSAAAVAGLYQIETTIEERRDRLDRDQRFLAELENEVDVRREGQATLLSQRLSGLGDVFSLQGKGALQQLSKRTSLLPSFLSLFQQEKLPTEIEKGFIEAVKEAVEERAGTDGAELVQDCRSHWETVEPRIRENLDVKAPSFEKETESLAGTRERFVRRLGRSAKSAIAHLKIRSGLDMQMEVRRMVLRRHMMLALGLLTGAGILGGLGWQPWPWVCVTLALIILVIAGFFSHFSRKTLCQTFKERVEDLRHPFADSLADDYKDGVREFYLEYGGLFEIVRRRIASQQQLLHPRMERWNNLFLELKAIEQEL